MLARRSLLQQVGVALSASVLARMPLVGPRVSVPVPESWPTAVWTGMAGTFSHDADDPRNWKSGRRPKPGGDVLFPAWASKLPIDLSDVRLKSLTVLSEFNG